MTSLPPPLRTERLILDGHRLDDLDALTAMWGDPAVYRHIGGVPRPREDVWIRLLRSIGTWTAFGYGSWVIRETEHGPAIGEAGLIEARRVIAPPIDAPEMGWVLAPVAQGRGYAHEALTAILGWADARGLGRTQCIIDPGNRASIVLAERLGYRLLGDAHYHDRTVRHYERPSA